MTFRILGGSPPLSAMCDWMHVVAIFHGENPQSTFYLHAARGPDLLGCAGQSRVPVSVNSGVP